MNRWSEAFDKHQFHTFWQNIVNTTDSIELGAEANENIVTEFMRFEKAMNLINSIIENLDKDTFHLQTLTNAQAPAQQVSNHLINFKRNQNDLNQIQAANNQIDQVLNFFRPYMVMPDAVAKAVKKVSLTQQKLLEQIKASMIQIRDEQLKELRAAVELSRQHLKEMDEDSEKSYSLYQRLFGEDGKSGLSSEIDALHIKIQSLQTEASKSNQSIQKLQQQAIQSHKDTENYEISAKQNSEEIEQMQAETGEELKALKSFYLKVFGKPDEEGKIVGGMKTELEEYKQEFNEYESEHKAKIDELLHEIESLLPGAVSAGLASEYKNLKDECTDPIKSFTKQFYWALTGLLLVGGFSFYYSIKNHSGLESILYNFIQVSPLLLPAIWFAVFTSRRRNELERLRQEYAHKQAVTSSYQSFKEQIDRLGANQPEMLSALMNTAIKTIGENASKILSANSKESSPIHETVSAIGQSVSKVTKSASKD